MEPLTKNQKEMPETETSQNDWQIANINRKRKEKKRKKCSGRSAGNPQIDGASQR